MGTRVVGNESVVSSTADVRADSAASPKGKASRTISASWLLNLAASPETLYDHPSDMMIWTFNPDGQCTYFSRAWLAFRGRKLEQELGFGWMHGIHPEDSNRCMTSFRIAFETRQPFHLDCRVQGANGGYVPMFGHGVPQYLIDGTLVGYAGSITVPNEQEALTDSLRSGLHVSRSIRELLCQTAQDLTRSVPLVLVQKTEKRRKPRARISVRALLQCLNLSVTPLIIVDKNGRALYCNNSFRTFCAQALRRPATAATETVKRARQKRAGCGPDVGAWLDSDMSMLSWGLRFVGHRLTPREADLTAFSIIDTSRDGRSLLLERAFLHNLINAAGSLRMLVDLLTECASHEEHSEYVNLLQVSVERLLSELNHYKVMVDASATGSKSSKQSREKSAAVR